MGRQRQGMGRATQVCEGAVRNGSEDRSQGYQTMPISLAASSQTQIGSSPLSNFRQRLSQSIFGTKQLKVEETDSGAPFFIQTRNRAGCSASPGQAGGVRIHSFPRK